MLPTELFAKGSGQAWVEKHCWKSLDDEDDYEEKDPFSPFDISQPPSIFRGSEQSGLEQLVGRVVA